jgi:hypothetical protein
MPVTMSELEAIVGGITAAAKAHIASEFAKRDAEIATLRARLDALEAPQSRAADWEQLARAAAESHLSST